MEVQGRGEVRDEGQLDLVAGRMWWVRERGKATVTSSALTWRRSKKGRAEKRPLEVAFEKSLVSSAEAVQ